MLAGPTAVGKGTVAACVRSSHPEIWISVSVTTRAPRPGEIDGVHYHFITEAEFDEMIANDGLLEWAVVHGAARYGTPRARVEERLSAGQPALLEIDLQGARQVRERMPDALMVSSSRRAGKNSYAVLSAGGPRDLKSVSVAWRRHALSSRPRTSSM